MPRGSKPGERRGGRQKGTPNKATKDIRELAQQHGPAAIAKALQLMEGAESEDTQLRAAALLIERGYGKAKEYVELTETGVTSRTEFIIREVKREGDV